MPMRKAPPEGTPRQSAGSKRKVAANEKISQKDGVPKRKVQKTAPAPFSDTTQAPSTSAHPFAWDPADDCETSIYAYRDVAPFLTKLAQRMKKSKSELAIYDPYYCKGTMATHLKKLGFTNVYNKDEDFYAQLDSGELPAHDVMVTSPPYSKDHIEKLVRHLQSTSKPWMVLMPGYVHRKQYYSPLLNGKKPFFLVPRKSYVYFAVNGGRSANTDVACRHWIRDGSCPKKDTCMFRHSNTEVTPSVPGRNPCGNSQGPTPVVPFHSFWHISLGSAWQNGVIQAWGAKYAKVSKCQLAKSIQELPALLQEV